jgi:NodT family efflux transporter outer membrane factor (OMF) lipoprotein
VLGCASNNQINQDLRDFQVPENWQKEQTTSDIKNNWLEQFDSPLLNSITIEALNSNQSLRQEAYKVDIAKQQLIKSGAALWPDLDLSLTTSRNKTSSPDVISNRNSLKLESSYEIDIWGKLSDNQKASQLSYLAAKTQYEQNKQTLVANIVSNWFNLVTANQLADLFQQRVNNAKQSLDIIESGYQQGVNKALDVYLSRNELNSEVANLAQQQTKLVASSRVLEQLLGRYPSGKLATQITKQKLPLLSGNIPLGLPSAIVSRKPALQAAWYQVLAQDATLAFTHKQRFPSIRLTASVSNSSDELGDLLSTSSIAWSLLGGLTAPIFNAGNLKANEEIAMLRLKQQEQSYLNTLYNSFAEVENAITSEASLQTRYAATLAAQENALAAETIAFEQYQRGLVNYTTVLNAQGRAFNAQSSLLQIKNQLLNNRANLHLALGGSFDQPSSNQNSINNNTTNQQDDSTDE